MSVRVRTKALLAWSLWLATIGCCAAGLLAALLWIRPLTLRLLAEGAALAVVFPLGYATIGLVLSLRRPANPIGWLYGASGLVWALVIPFEPWLAQLGRDHQPLALAAQLTAVASEVIWAPAIALGVILPFLLLPEGRLRSRRWRVVVAATVVGVAMFVIGAILSPGQTSSGPVAIDNPFGLAGVAGTAAKVVAFTGLVLYAVSLPAALVCVVLRFRSSRGVERQQLRWVAAGAAVAVIVLLPLPGGEWLPAFLLAVGLLAMPVSVAVAVLRYRLWDLDRLVSRTVTYAVVTGLLVLPYLLILPAVTRLAGDAGGLAVAAATLAAAAVFQPLRRRVQDLVDRRFNRRRYDAARTVEAFAARLREQVDLDALSAELLAVVEQTVAPTQTWLWLRPATSSRVPP
jgi:uncharacterized membrane protein YtjA (UPF0391 family)